MLGRLRKAHPPSPGAPRSNKPRNASITGRCSSLLHWKREQIQQYGHDAPVVMTIGGARHQLHLSFERSHFFATWPDTYSKFRGRGAASSVANLSGGVGDACTP